ncbi:hypothetical protein CEXT_17451 [Caerostris extrusa]|uniref:Carboxylesterase type B domain-containing protein n=1 Tax=Caerostris extrusa TaxID=172846 RepID=A0AAV4QRP7_CAEEX|nr:hypothetical protein CEXT_17451 [Caerostris extrusa]
MSAAIHAFSPLSQEEKLFENVILQSGVPDGNWAYDRNPLKTTYDFARAVNCYFPELQKIVDCMRNQPAETLLNTAMKLPARFRPTYDFNLIHENALKAAAGSNYAPINIMIGFNSDEGSLLYYSLKGYEFSFL